MLSLELLQVDRVLLVFVGLLVFAQVLVVLVLSELGLRFKGLTLCGRQALPIFADVLCDLRECQVFALQLFPRLCCNVLATSLRTPSVPTWLTYCWKKGHMRKAAVPGRSHRAMGCC